MGSTSQLKYIFSYLFVHRKSKEIKTLLLYMMFVFQNRSNQKIWNFHSNLFSLTSIRVQNFKSNFENQFLIRKHNKNAISRSGTRYFIVDWDQGWPERGLLGLRQPPNIHETTPAFFNHIRKNEFPFTTILVGDCRNRHESSISEVSASFRRNRKKFSVCPLAKMMLYVP